MNKAMTSAGRVILVFCVVTTLAVAIFVATLAAGGFLTSDRVDAAVRGLRGEAAGPMPAPVTVTAVSGPTPGDLREMETLVAMAEARDRDLRLQADRVRAEKRTAETTEKPVAGVVPAPGGTSAPLISAGGDKFKSNLDVLRNHLPKTAATLMADWETAEIVGYLRAMKPYEASDIVGAMLTMGKRGETDYAVKAKEVQAALGK
ncbi:MAG: hypothetical protein AAB074_12790 [Planctomycetota bacterium]